MQGKNKCNSHATIKYYMLSFGGCNDYHIAPRYDKQCKYAEFKYGKYVGKGVYVAYVKYSEYAGESVYSAEGEYSKNAKEDASIEEGHNKPLAKEGNNEPFAKDGDWAGYNNKPFATTRAIGCICHARR
jgi:hypothetical protein